MGLDQDELTKKHNLAFDNALNRIALEIFSKQNNKDGWKSLKNITKYNLIGKKEGKIVDKILDKDNNTLTGPDKDNIIIKHFEETHKENNPID